MKQNRNGPELGKRGNEGKRAYVWVWVCGVGEVSSLVYIRSLGLEHASATPDNSENHHCHRRCYSSIYTRSHHRARARSGSAATGSAPWTRISRSSVGDGSNATIQDADCVGTRKASWDACADSCWGTCGGGCGRDRLRIVGVERCQGG